MRRGRILIFVVLILIVLVGMGFFGLNQILSQPTAPENTQADYVEIFRTSQPIPQGGDITDGVITTMKVLRTDLIEVEFTLDERAVLTTNKVAKYSLDQGVVLTEGMLADKGTAVAIAGPQWAVQIPAGMTAISIPADRLAMVGYGVADGAHVNVNACFMFVDVDPTFQTELPNLTAIVTGTGFGPDAIPVLSLGVGAAGSPQGRLELEPSLQQPYYVVPSQGQRPRVTCQMLLQDVVVMRRGNFPLSGALTDQPSADPNAQSAPQFPDLVTLIVSPQDSITLTYLIYTCGKVAVDAQNPTGDKTTGCSSQIILTLRNPNDQARQATEAATLQFLLSQYNIPVPAKLPYSLQPIFPGLQDPSLPNDVTNVPPEQ